MATDHDFKIKNGARVSGERLILGSSAFSQDANYVGLKTSAMTGSQEYMIISAPTDKHTYISAGSGNSVYIRGGGNSSAHELAVSASGASFAGNLTVSGNFTATSGITSSGNLTVSVPDGGGSPAMTATINIRGYEGRGAGIKIRDSANSASNASNREWFIGSGYSQSGFNIGYSSTGSQSSYAAQNKLSIDTSGNVTAAGSVTWSGGSSANANTAYGWGNHASAGYLTSHQSLSAYLLNTTDTFAGNLTFIGGNNSSKESFINVKRGDASGLWLKFQTDSTSTNNVSQFVIRRSTDSVDILNLSAASGNISFVGTLSSGAITSTGKLTLNDPSVGGWIQSNGSIRLDIDNDNDQTNRAFIVSKDNGATNLLTIYEDAAATFAGTISSGAITSTGASTFGGVQIGGTTVISSSRNLTNIGTISSGAITSSGKLEVNQAGNGTSNAPSSVAEFSGQSAGGVLKALSLVNSVSSGSGNGTQLAFHNASDYSPTGTISVIQDGDTVTDSKMVFQIYRGSLQDALTIDHDENMSVGSIRLTDSSVMGFGTAKSASSIGHTASVDEGIFWHSSNAYGIYRTSGAWSSPNYQQLKIEWATGIELHGGNGYGKSGVNIIGSSDLKMAGITVIDPNRDITARQATFTHTTHNYVSIEASINAEQMVRFKNSASNYWYAGIRTSAGIASTADFHIYSTALADDAFALTTSGDLVAKRNLNTKTGDVQINGTSVIDSSLNIGAGGAADSNYDLKVYGLARFQGAANFVSATNPIQVGGTTIIDASRNLANIGTISSGAITLTNGSHLQTYTSDNETGTGGVDLPRGGHITFYGNNANNHSIGSRNHVGNITDDLRISSYGALYIDLDSNSNNSSDADFVIGKHGNGTGSISTLVTISGEDGNYTSSGNISLEDGKAQVGEDGSYSGYGVLGFGGITNGYNRVFGRDDTNDGLFLAAATGRNVFVRSNGEGSDSITLGTDGSYSTYKVVGFGSTVTNGRNRIFARADTSDGMYINSATGRDIYFRTNGSGSNAFVMTAAGNFQVVDTTVIDQQRNFYARGTASSTTPRYTFEGDTNTGLGYIGTDQVGLISGGSRKFYVSSTGAFFQNLTDGVTLPKTVIAHSQHDGFKITATDSTANTPFSAMKLDYNISGTDTCTTDRNHVGLHLDIDSSASGGLTNHEHRLYGVLSDVRTSGDSDVTWGGQFTTRVDDFGAGNQITQMGGVYGQSNAHNADGVVSTNFGSYGYAINNSSGTGQVNVTRGASNLAYAASTSTYTGSAYIGSHNMAQVSPSQSADISYVAAVWGEVQFDNDGAADHDVTISNAYVFRAEYDENDGDDSYTVNTGYLYYGNYAGTQPTTAYGVYIQDAVRNYFAGSLTAGLGSTTTASYGFNGDINTGMYAPANHEVGFLANGAQRLKVASTGIDVTGAITTSGRIDITTNNTVSEPYVAFGITQSSTTHSAGLFLNPAGGRKYEIQSTTADELIFYDRDSSAYRLRIMANGNLKIESGNLQMSGTTVIDSSRNLTNISTIQTSGNLGVGVAPNTTNCLLINRVSGHPNIKSSDAYMLMDSNSGMAGLNWYSSDRVVLANGGGNVGIGSSGNHTQKLYVSGSVRSTSTIRADAGFEVNGTAVIDTGRVVKNITSLGIGLAGPSKNLHVYTAANEGIFLQGTSNGVWMDVQSATSELWSMGADTNGWAIYNRTDSLYRLRCENGGDVDVVSGGLKVGGTTVIDTSRNLTNINHLYVSGNIYHNGDTNTYVQFTNDRIRIVAGGVMMLDCIEGGTDYIDIINRVRVTAGGDLECEGNITAYSTTSISDINQKENIQQITDPIEKIKQISGYTFDWKNTGEHSGGVIAQEVEEIMPDVVKEVSIRDGDEMKAVDYQAITGLLVETVKEQQEKIEKLEELVKKLISEK